MEFKLSNLTGNDDANIIIRGVRSVDPDARVGVDLPAMTVQVDSWLMPEEFLIAFNEAGYDVRISRA
ncbi:copper chaperone [Paraburkholderia silviterrae]|uniref:Copper chaperone n=2 Tax=Paraburkholderia silviterrae TaxID=2528715 RepID=A0A4R5M9X6_9BURK|nr:copper chaperone [Paraburkholderia silviterrae]